MRCLMVLLLLAHTGGFAQRSTESADLEDAYVILEGKPGDDCTPNGDVQAIVRELQAIRKAIPQLAGVHAMGSYAPQELILSLNEFTPTRMPELDNLNRKFGAIGMSDLGTPGDWTVVSFSKRLDMFCVADAYKKVVGDLVQPDYYVGDGNRILRAQKKDEFIHYVFRIGRGDCPSGCTEEDVFYLNLHSTDEGYRISKVEGPPPFHSMWGYPSRFPLRIFRDYDDLIDQTGNPDWSIRLHAVSALGRVFATGGSSLGEDVFTTSAAGKAASNPAAIVSRINENRDLVSNILEEKATSDPDEDVRRAAKDALRFAEELRKSGALQ